MYNGIGLLTARGSGTNGYVQTNKFFVRPKTGKVAETTRGFEADQGTAGVTRKPNKDILEHDRKRQIELKLVVIEDKLIDQGYTDAEITEKLAEVRKTLQAAAFEETGGSSAIVIQDKKVLDTQTHQIAARKEKQMETLRAALGIAPSDFKEQNTENDDPSKGNGKSLEDDDWKHQEKPEHAFLDRDQTWKKQPDEDQKADKETKKLASKRSKGNKKEQSKKKDEYHSDSSGKQVRKVQKKHHKGDKRGNRDDSSDSDADMRYKTSKKHKKSTRQNSDDSDSVSDVQDIGEGIPKRKVQNYKLSGKKRYSDEDSDTDGGSSKEKERQHSRRRHDFKDKPDTSSEREDIGEHQKNKNLYVGRDKKDRCDSDVKGQNRGYNRRDIRHSRKCGENGESDSTDSEKYKKTTTKKSWKNSRHDTDDDSDIGSDEKVEKHKSRGHDFNDKESNKGKERYGSKSGNSGRSKLKEGYVSHSKHGISDDNQEKENDENEEVKNNRPRIKNYSVNLDIVRNIDEGRDLGLEKKIKSVVVGGKDKRKEKLSKYDQRDADIVSRSQYESEDHLNKRKLEDRNDAMQPLLKSGRLNSGIDSEYHEGRGKDNKKTNESPPGGRTDLDLEEHGGRRYSKNEEVQRGIKHTRDEYDHISRGEEKDDEEQPYKSTRLGGGKEDDRSKSHGKNRDVNYSDRARHDDFRTSERGRRDEYDHISRRDAKDDEERPYKSRRLAGAEEDHGSKSHGKNRDINYSDKARRDDSRTSERARDEDSRTSEMAKHDDSQKNARARHDEYRISERAHESNKLDGRRTQY